MQWSDVYKFYHAVNDVVSRVPRRDINSGHLRKNGPTRIGQRFLLLFLLLFAIRLTVAAARFAWVHVWLECKVLEMQQRIKI